MSITGEEQAEIELLEPFPLQIKKYQSPDTNEYWTLWVIYNDAKCLSRHLKYISHIFFRFSNTTEQTEFMPMRDQVNLYLS